MQIKSVPPSTEQIRKSVYNISNTHFQGELKPGTVAGTQAHQQDYARFPQRFKPQHESSLILSGGAGYPNDNLRHRVDQVSFRV